MARTDLKVPFAEKDEAKALGARWDPAKRLWYTQSADLSAFERWLPAPGETAAPARPAAARKPAAVSGASSGFAQRGTRFFELDCDCLPWEGCPKCQAAINEQGWNKAA
jgi:hypothetical protein